jgi:hypothetical protein
MTKPYLQAISNFNRVSNNPTIALFTKGSYIHSYKTKICIHNSLQNIGTIRLVVKTLAVRLTKVFNFNVLSTCTPSAMWEILVNTEIFITSLMCHLFKKAYVMSVQKSKNVTVELFTCTKNESYLTEIPVERYMQEHTLPSTEHNIYCIHRGGGKGKLERFER